MKRIITNLFTFALVIMFASACNSDDEFVSDNNVMQEDKSAELTTRAPYYPNSLQFDIFTDRCGENYYTFLVTEAVNCALSETDPFPFYYYDDDISQPRTFADYSQISLYDGGSRIEFGESGFLSSVPYYYDMENGIGHHYVLKLGDKIAIWASKEKYTIDDLKLHDGDEEYFARVSESFELCYITVLKRYTTITYGMWEPEWQG